MINFFDIELDRNGNPKLKLLKSCEMYNNRKLSIEEIVSILNDSEGIKDLYMEKAYVVGLNTSMDVVGVYNASIGNSDHCNFFIRNILTFLLLSGSSMALFLHNHPNNAIEPSADDIASYYWFVEQAKIFDIDIFDSIVVCKDGWSSIKNGEVFEYEEDEF